MFKIFVVFHKQIFDDCYTDISQDILNKHFVFIAVNPAIPKIVTPGRYNAIHEWELPLINQQLDNAILRENTAIYHVFLNKLHAGCDYVGFAQYDMKFTETSLKQISSLSPSSYMALSPNSLQFCKDTACNGSDILDATIKSYEQFFSTTFNPVIQVPLCNTYIISATLFNKIMSWIAVTYSQLIPLCYTFYPYRANPYYIASIYERVMGIAIGAENLTILPFDLVHDHGYKQQAY